MEMLVPLFRWLLLAAVSAWVGGSIAISYIVAPTASQFLGAQGVGRFMGVIFRKFSLVIYLSSAVIGPAVALEGYYATTGNRQVFLSKAVLLLLMVLAGIYLDKGLSPEIVRLRDQIQHAQDSQQEQQLCRRFDYLIKLAGRVFSLSMALGLLVLLVIAFTSHV